MMGSRQPAPTPDIANIQDQQLSSNEQSVPVPYVAGTRKVAVTWMSREYNIGTADVSDDSSKGKGGGQPKNVYGTVAGCIGAGLFSALVSVIVDGKAAWPPRDGVWHVGAAIVTGKLWLYNEIVWKALTTHTASTANAPDSAAGATNWVEYDLARGTDVVTSVTVPGRGTMRLYWGTMDQTVDTKLQSANNNFGEQHPDYKGICYAVFDHWLFGRNRYNAPNVEIVMRRAPQQSTVTDDPAGLIFGQANAAAIAAEAFTDANFLGLATPLDDTSFQATAEALHANQSLAGASVIIDSQITVRELLEKLHAMGDTFTRFNPSTKKIEMGFYPHGDVPAEFTALSAADMAERPKFTTPLWTDVKSRTVIRFPDRAFAYTDVSDKADDARAFTVLGEVRVENVELTYCTRRDQALAYAIERLRSVGRPLLQGELVVRREKARDVRPGDYAQVDTQLEPGGAANLQYFRVVYKTTPNQGPIKLSVLGDNTLSPIPYAPSTAAVLGVDSSVPAIANARILEASNALIGASGDIIVLAERPDTITTGFDVFFDTDPAGSFLKLGSMAGFAGRATLTDDIVPGDTTIGITVPDQADLSPFSVQPGDVGAANDTFLAFLIATDGAQIKENPNGYPIVEVCSVSAQALVGGSDYNLTVLRGRRGSTANSFTTDNTEVWLIARSVLEGFLHADFETLRRNRLLGNDPHVGQFRLVPYTFLAARDLADCANVVFQFAIANASQPVITASRSGIPITNTLAIDLSGGPLPGTPGYGITFDLSATDSLGLINSYVVYKFLSTYSEEQLVKKGAPTPASTLNVKNVFVPFETNGTFEVRIFVGDAKGNEAGRTLLFIVTGIPATPHTLGLVDEQTGQPIWMFGENVLADTERAAFGVITAVPSASDCTVYWSSRFSVDGVTWSDWTGWTDQSVTPAVHSLLGLAGDNANQVMMQEFRAYATRAGYHDSDVTTVHFDDFTPVTG